MRRAFILAAATIAILAIAVVLRIRDQPYINYVHNKPAEALSGLIQKAQKGDGFAAYLVGGVYSAGAPDVSNRQSAALWYVNAAKLGEIRAISGYFELALQSASPAEMCRTFPALELAGRTGDTHALSTLGYAYRTGQCTPPDLVKAAEYLKAAVAIDGRFWSNLAAVMTQLPPAEAQAIQAVPDRFDVAPADALARFVADAAPLNWTVR